MTSWLIAHPEIVEAASTLFLAFFAAVQVGLEAGRRKAERRAAARRTLGLAWLARRNCEAAIVQARGETSAYEWLRAVAQPYQLNLMERRMLAMLTRAAHAGGDTAAAGEIAFSHFLAFADRVNGNFPVSQIDDFGNPRPSQEERANANEQVRNALVSLWAIVHALESIAPRREHEKALPPPNEFPLYQRPISQDP